MSDRISISDLEREIDQPRHIINHALSRYGPKPCGRVGIARVWRRSDLPAIRESVAKTSKYPQQDWRSLGAESKALQSMEPPPQFKILETLGNGEITEHYAFDQDHAANMAKYILHSHKGAHLELRPINVAQPGEPTRLGWIDGKWKPFAWSQQLSNGFLFDMDRDK